MRFLDRFLQNWRASVARPWVPRGANVLDIGCHQGEFLASLGDDIGPSVGIDPLARADSTPRYRLQPEPFTPPTLFADESFDVIVMLATLEHIQDKAPLCHECLRLLRPGGRVLITVPSPRVDAIVGFLSRLKLIDGMSPEERHGYDALSTPRVFGAHGFHLEYWRPFQLGLNFLFVLRKPGKVARPAPVAQPSAPTEVPVHV